MKRVAVIGATGMLGYPVTHELIRAGFTVTLMVRDMNKTKQIFGTNVHYASGDLRDRDSIARLLTNQDIVYLNLSVAQQSRERDFQPERDGLLHLLTAAKKAGVSRIGYLSSLVHLYQGKNGFDWWVFKLKRDAVSAIKKSGIPFTIFYPSTFMESFDKGAFRQGNNLLLAGTSRYPMHLIAASDYGKQVANAFQINAGNCEYIVQGKEAFTADIAARIAADNYKISQLKVLKMPMGLLKFFGMFTPKMSYAAHMVEALNNYEEKFSAENTWNELGTPQVTFREYLGTVK